MRALLVNPAAVNNLDPLSLPLGLLSIATVLKKHQHEVSIFESASSNERIFRKTIRDYQPDVIGVSVISGKAVKNAVQLSKAAREMGIPVVWGGILPSFMAEQVLQSGCADIVSIGEGEQTWLDLMEALEKKAALATVRGLAFIEEHKLKKTELRPLLDLAEIPPLDFDILDIEKYVYSYYSSRRAVNLYSSKGCPGHCTFCYNNRFNHSIHRVRPVEQVLGEIGYLHDRYNIDGIVFVDDAIFGSSKDMHQLCSAFKASGLPVTWGCFGLVGQFDQEELREMFSAGCRWIFFGVESGSREVLKKIKKGIKYELIEETFLDCYQTGIITRAGFIIGFPGETQSQLKDTVSLAKRLMTSQVSVNYYSPVIGSASYEELLGDGIITHPVDLAHFSGAAPFDKLENYSQISDIDLKVVYSFFLLRRFKQNQNAPGQEKRLWRSISVSFIIKSIQQHSYRKVMKAVAEVAKALLLLAAHPRIRKNYGLVRDKA